MTFKIGLAGQDRVDGVSVPDSASKQDVQEKNNQDVSEKKIQELALLLSWYSYHHG